MMPDPSAHALAELIPHAAWVADPSGHCLYVNRQWQEYTGLSAAAAVGDGWRQAAHPDDLTTVGEKWGAAAASGGAFEAPVRLRRHDGEYRWHVSRAVGGAAPWVGTVTDVHDWREAEGAARRDREFLRLVLDTDPNLIFVKDADGRFVLVNQALANLYGLTPADMIGRRPGDGLPAPSEIDAYCRADQEVLQTGRSSTALETNTRPDGRVFRFYTVRAPLRLPDGTTHLLGIAIDVTARTAAEAEARRTADLLQAVTDGTTDAVFVKDRAGRYLFVNPAAARYMGHPADRVIGRTDAELLDPATAVRLADQDRRVMDAGPLTEEWTVPPADGGRTFQVTKAPYRDPQGGMAGVIGVSRDVTEFKRLEEHLRQSQKMEALGRLAGGVAHDFNNLLTVIRGFCDLVLPDLAGHPAREMVAEIALASDRATDLTRQLLAFSRRSGLTARVLDPTTLVRGLEPLLRRLLGEDVELVVRLDPAAGRVRADPGQLEQALVNLCVNARDAMPGGGRLVLDCRSAAAEPPADRYVVLSVADTGHGMSDEVKARLFEPFFTTKEPGRGTGLGLALVFGFAQQSGGRVEVESAPGQGATVRLYLPRVDAPAEPPGGRSTSPVPRGTETVLVAEDDAAVRRLAARVLAGCGYTVLEAADGWEAVRLAAAHPADVHLLLTDVMMPGGMSGRQVAVAVAERHPNVRLLYFSGHGPDQLTRQGVGPPHAQFLPKPFTPSALARKVRQVLDTG